MYYDLAIIGGGLVGAGLAAALHAVGGRIALIDARIPTNSDPRLIALNDTNCEFLKKIQIWSELESQATPIHQVHVSKQGRFGAVRLKSEDVGLTSLGHVVPAYVIEQVLHARLLKQANVAVFQPARLQSLEQKEGYVNLGIHSQEGEKVLAAQLVIGADGTDSMVRKLLHVSTTQFDYQQTAIVTRTRLQRGHKNIAYERFNEHGAVAMLPLLENECATIWSTKPELAQELLALGDEAFVSRLQNAFGYRLGRLHSITQRHSFPLRMLQAQDYVSEHIFLLGNSAHTLHPIAAQGFNLALYEVNALVDGIADKWQTGKQVSGSDLNRIKEQTEKQQSISIGFSHQLAKLFNHPSPGLSCLIQLGMLGLDLTVPAKKLLMEQLLGRKQNIFNPALSKQTL